MVSLTSRTTYYRPAEWIGAEWPESHTQHHTKIGSKPLTKQRPICIVATSNRTPETSHPLSCPEHAGSCTHVWAYRYTSDVTLPYGVMASSVCLLFLALLLQLRCIPGTDHEGLPGHMQPLGSHMDPEPVRRVSHLPTPREFYEGYVATKTPLVIEGALKGSPVWKNWQDDGYIRSIINNIVRPTTLIATTQQPLSWGTVL